MHRGINHMNDSEVDYVPCIETASLVKDGWDQFERAKKTTKLGLEDTVGFEIRHAFSPEVNIVTKADVTRRTRSGPIPPQGALKQIVRQTKDCPWRHYSHPTCRCLLNRSDSSITATRDKCYIRSAEQFGPKSFQLWIFSCRLNISRHCSTQ